MGKGKGMGLARTMGGGEINRRVDEGGRKERNERWEHIMREIEWKERRGRDRERDTVRKREGERQGQR